MTIYKSAEIRVNTTTAENQTNADVVVLADGGWVVTWTSDQQDGSGDGIFQQRFDATGQPIGSEQQVNITTAGSQNDQCVSSLSDGGWIVTWTSQETDGSSNVYQQRYDQNGNAAWVADRLVSAVTANDQIRSSVTGLSDGGWIVTFTSFGQDGDGAGVYQRRFDSGGMEAPGGDQVVNTFTTGNQSGSSVAALSGGGWVVTWVSTGQDNGIPHIYQRRFDMNGAAQSSGDENVSPATGFQSGSSITQLADGGWVVTWTDTNGSNRFVYQQRFQADGTVGTPAPVLVSVDLSTASAPSRVTMLSDGGWVVTWARSGAAESGIFQRHYDKNGVASSPKEQLVKGSSGGFQSEPVVTAIDHGGWLVTWTSSNGFEQDIHQQRYLPNSAPTDVTASGTEVAEGAADGTLAATLAGADANLAAGDALTYTLVEDAQGRFALQGDKLVVANGLRLDHEQASSHNVTVRATDKDGLSVTRTIAVQVGDVAREDLTGSAAADTFVGGAGADAFRGLGGDDTLTGGDGNDVLSGGLGKDMLIGGGGRDIFVFETRPDKRTNTDTLADFSARDDSIWLENSVFRKIGSGSIKKPGKLKKDFFTLGTAAKDKNDHVIYNLKKHTLYFDSDGKGGKAAIEVAVLKKGVHLTAADFFVI